MIPAPTLLGEQGAESLQISKVLVSPLPYKFEPVIIPEANPYIFSLLVHPTLSRTS